MKKKLAAKKLKLILASQSPRRREILESAGFTCYPCPSNSSESFDENLTLDENLCEIAETKVQTVLATLSIEKRRGILILGADTVVVANKRVLGKPKNSTEARRMLRLLSGRAHCVMTCYSLYCPDEDRGVTRIVKTIVGFRRLSAAEVQWYVDTGEPFDKAGGYGIQGLAQHFVNYVDGDLLNVVGLPLYSVKQELRKHRWSIAHARSAAKRTRKNR